MFSQTTKLCLNALAYLIDREPGTLVQSNSIAEKLGVSATYVTKAFRPLCRRGWLESVKGRGGGWILSLDPSNVTLAEVVDVLEPESQWAQCVVGHEVCTDDDGCPFHSTWCHAIGQIRDIMTKTKLTELSKFMPQCFNGAPTDD